MKEIKWKNFLVSERFIVLLFICLVVTLYNFLIPVSLFSDSLTYLELSHFYSTNALIPLSTSISSGYSILIAICRFISDSPAFLVIIFQLLSSIILLYCIFLIGKIKNSTFAFILLFSSLILLVPLAFSKSIMTDHLYLFLLFILFYFSTEIILKNKYRYIYAFPILSIFLVQVRTTGIVFPFIFFLILFLTQLKIKNWKMCKIILANFLLFIFFHFSFLQFLSHLHKGNLDRAGQLGTNLFLHSYLSMGIIDNTTPKIVTTDGPNSEKLLQFLDSIIADPKMFPELYYAEKHPKVIFPYYLKYEKNPQELLRAIITSPVRCYWSTILRGLSDRLTSAEKNKLLIGVSFEIIKNNPQIVFQWISRNFIYYFLGVNANYKNIDNYRQRFARVKPYLNSLFVPAPVEYLGILSTHDQENLIRLSSKPSILKKLEVYGLIIWPYIYLATRLPMFILCFFGLIFFYKESFYPVILLGNLISLTHASMIILIGVPIVRYNMHTYLIELFISLLVGYTLIEKLINWKFKKKQLA